MVSSFGWTDEPGWTGSVRRGLALAAIILLGLTPTTHASEIQGRVDAISQEAHYEVWLTTSLDISAPDQPKARAVVDKAGHFQLSWTSQQSYWLFLHQRIHPEGGPPLDLFLPHDLRPRIGAPDKPIVFQSIDPHRLWQHERWSFDPSVLTKLALLCLIVFGLGATARLTLKNYAAPEGLRSAPLYDRVPPAKPRPGELGAVVSVLVLAAALRLRGMASQSLDLLEVSYLPGIGRPTPTAGLGAGLAGLPDVLREVGDLYCLDLVHTPLYHLILGLVGLAGTQEWLLRLPALLASLTTALLIWRLFRRTSPQQGVASMTLCAVAAPAIYFGQDATPYAVIALCAVGSVHLALRALEDGRTRSWFQFFFVLVLGYFCHYAIALVGLAEVGLLVVLARRNKEDRRWAAAAWRATGPALLLAPLPLLWSWAHFSTFPTVAQHTRLIADTYPIAPGLLPFLWDFLSVTAGVAAGTSPWSVAAGVALALLGLRALAARESSHESAAVLCALLVAFLFSISLFYLGVSENLGGRIFYGFRWVSWFQPLLLGLVAMGTLHSKAPWLLRSALAIVWLLGAGQATFHQVTKPPRPDYEGAAELVQAQLLDRDGFATLPAWFQRGNLAHYLDEDAVPPAPHSPDGAATWTIGEKRFVLEAIHVSLPFETTARNGHLERLWVAVVEETMFGRDKFSREAAQAAVAWADEHLVREAEWQLNQLQLILYRIPKGEDPALPVRGTLNLSAENAVLDHRTYPLLEEELRFRRGADIKPMTSGLGATVRLQAPRSPSCVEWDWGALRSYLNPEAPHHWYLSTRVPVGANRGQPVVLKRGPAQLETRMERDSLYINAVGQSCDQPPLELKVLSPESAAALEQERPGDPSGLGSR
ncbi:MAG TPA: hypothetical protein DIU15_17360 [Deltaproteobacteria bacterium]|nr:hypothetical protein [Deltaproteobacteria bacterium]HCP47813.1 hypothetical protein [Deltaproteobacteria bacterium]